VDDHSSGTFVTECLKQPTRKSRSDTALQVSLRLPYLALLPAGFAVPQVLPPARCALTTPFHPYLRSLPQGEFAHRRYLSVALSVGSRPPGVTWRRIRRSPDFPLHFARNTAIAWPTPGATIPPDGSDHKRAPARSPQKVPSRRHSKGRERALNGAQTPAQRREHRPRRDSRHSPPKR